MKKRPEAAHFGRLFRDGFGWKLNDFVLLFLLYKIRNQVAGRREYNRSADADIDRAVVREAVAFQIHLLAAFKREEAARFDDELEVRLEVDKYTGVRLEVAYTFFNKTRDELCTTAHSAHCFMKDGRIVSLQKALPDAHERMCACL